MQIVDGVDLTDVEMQLLQKTDPTAVVPMLEDEDGDIVGLAMRSPSRRGTASSHRTSISSYLDIRPLHLHLAPTSTTAPIVVHPKPPATLTLLHATALIVGCIIGSGIFAAPGPILESVGSIGASLFVWMLSAIIASFGAKCYADLGLRIPVNGGDPIYLERAYGELLAFLYEWSAVFLMRPGGHAIVLIVFADYASRAVITDHHDSAVSYSLQKAVAIGGLTAISFLHAVSLRAGTWAQTAFTMLKLAAVAAIAAVGLAVLTGLESSPLHTSGELNRTWWEGTRSDAAGWSLAFYSGLFAYDGWNALNYVAGELRDPNDLPRAIVGGLTCVCISYLLVNLAYVAVVPRQVLITSNTVALDFAHRVFGKHGGIIVALAVALSAFGAAIGSIFTGSRLIHATAARGHLPSRFARLHAKTMTPIWALILQHVLTCFYILTGTFTSLVKVCGALVWVYYGLCAVAVWRLRNKHAHRSLARDIIAHWWVWGFLVAVAMLLGVTIMRETAAVVAAMGVTASGGCVWLLVLRRQRFVAVLQSILQMLPAWARIGLRNSDGFTPLGDEEE